MSIILIAIVFVVLAVFFARYPKILLCIKKLPLVIAYGVADLVRYFVRKEYNRAPVGEIVAFCGLFGKGKTLSDVARINYLYSRYNDRIVWCVRRKKYVTQKVLVMSNVDLNIPYLPFRSMNQIVEFTMVHNGVDDENDTLTILYVLGDEFSVQMNSRNFKGNLDPLALNTILTCRHHYISIYYTAQRFGHVDALLRQVTSYVFLCNKTWRFQGLEKYDAWDMENATSASMVKPIGRMAWFVKNKHYKAYNTQACVDNLVKASMNGDMLTPDQIMQGIGLGRNMCNEAVEHPSKKLKKLRKGA